MYVDAQTLVSDAQAITVDAVSTHTIDLGNPTPKNEIGAGEPIGFEVTVDVAADVADGNETYVFELIQSANSNLSSPDILMSRDIPRATLVAGYKFHLTVPIGSVTKRYLGLNYNVGGTTPTITVTAWLTPSNMVDAHMTYAKGYIVS